MSCKPENFKTAKCLLCPEYGGNKCPLFAFGEERVLWGYEQNSQKENTSHETYS